MVGFQFILPTNSMPMLFKVLDALHCDDSTKLRFFFIKIKIVVRTIIDQLLKKYLLLQKIAENLSEKTTFNLIHE